MPEPHFCPARTGQQLKVRPSRSPGVKNSPLWKHNTKTVLRPHPALLLPQRARVRSDDLSPQLIAMALTPPHPLPPTPTPEGGDVSAHFTAHSRQQTGNTPAGDGRRGGPAAGASSRHAAFTLLCPQAGTTRRLLAEAHTFSLSGSAGPARRWRNRLSPVLAQVPGDAPCDNNAGTPLPTLGTEGRGYSGRLNTQLNLLTLDKVQRLVEPKSSVVTFPGAGVPGALFWGLLESAR